LIIILKTLTFHISQDSVVTHFGCCGTYSDSYIANCLLILTVKELWKSVNIWSSYEAYENGAIFWSTLYIILTAAGFLGLVPAVVAMTASVT